MKECTLTERALTLLMLRRDAWASVANLYSYKSKEYKVAADEFLNLQGVELRIRRRKSNAGSETNNERHNDASPST